MIYPFNFSFPTHPSSPSLSQIVREYLQLVFRVVGGGQCSSYWDFPILVFVEGLVSFSYFAGAPHKIVSPSLCQTICTVTFLASHDRIIYLLAPLLYWLHSSSREVLFTMQGSRTACITQSLTHIGMPRTSPSSSYVRFTMGSYPTNAPEYTFAVESLANGSPTFCTGFHPSRYQGIYVPLGAPSLWSCYRPLARCLFHECSGSDFIVTHHPPLPFIRRMACAPSVEGF